MKLTISLINFGFALLVMCFNAFVLQNLWAWFVAETFAVDPLSLRIALGLNLLVSVFIFDATIHTKLGQLTYSDDEYATIVSSFTSAVTSGFYSLFVLIIGWFVHVL